MIMLSLGSIFENVLSEKVSDEQSLRVLSRLILQKFTERVFKQYQVSRSLDSKRLPSVRISEISIDATLKNVTTTKDVAYKNKPMDKSVKQFVWNYWDTWIYFKSTESTNGRGKFVLDSPRYIEIYISEKTITYINSLGQEYTGDRLYSMLYATFFNDCHSTLLHELQHAYDDFRSNSKIFLTKKEKEFSRNYTDKNSLNNDEKIKLRNDYLKLNSEVNARYNQAIDNLEFFNADIGDDDFVYTKKPFKEISKDFRWEFYGWGEMTDNVKKRLLHRLYKTYSEVEHN